MKEITFTIDSYSFSTVPNNSCCREQCCSEISDKTGKTYFWMREETGNKNWVLYNPNEYYVRKDSEYRCEHLHLSHSFKGKVHLPINASSCCGMFNGLDLAQLDFSEIDASNIVDMSEMFDSCKLGKTFTPIFNTSNVKTMRMMFMDCEKTEEMDLSHFDVSKVVDLSQMLSGCLDLEKINLAGWNTESAEDLCGMFSNCYTIKELDLSHFNTDNLKYMGYMFSNCSSLEWINLAGWDFSQVVDMSELFCQCGNLIEITITAEHNSTKRLEYTSEMFNGCESLTTINLAWLDLSKVSSVSNMFECCTVLEELDLSKVNAKAIKYSDCIFEGCSNLAKLNLTGLKMENLVAGWYMFKNCYNLKEILVTDFPNKLNDEQKNSMFENCGGACFTLVTKA